MYATARGTARGSPGIIGALTNNSEGIAGSTWSSVDLAGARARQVRRLRLGHPRGDGWAGGLHVNGVPDNPYPREDREHESRRGRPCTPAYGSVVSQLAARGVLVVVSAGNEGGPVGSPANCAGVAAVTGLRHAGTKVGFASLGPEVAIGAPGGNCVNVTGGPCLFSIDTTSNDGTHDSRGLQLYESDERERRHELLGADRLRDRWPHGRREREPRQRAAASRGCERVRRRRSRLLGPDDSDVSRPGGSERTVQTARVQLHDEHVRAGMANALRRVERGAAPDRGAFGARERRRRGRTVNSAAPAAPAHATARSATYFWHVVRRGRAQRARTTRRRRRSTRRRGLVHRSACRDRRRRSGKIGRHRDQLDDTTTTAPAACRQQRLSRGHPPPAAIAVAVSPASASLDTAAELRLSRRQSRTRALASRGKSTASRAATRPLARSRPLALYTAPAAVPSPATVTVTATSVEDPTKSGSAQVTITAPAPLRASAPAASGGGGGGAGFDLLFLLCALTAFTRLARGSNARCGPRGNERGLRAAQLVTIVYSSAARRTLDWPPGNTHWRISRCNRSKFSSRL